MVIDESWPKFLAKAGMGGIAVFLVYQLSVGVQKDVQETSVALREHVQMTGVASSVERNLLNALVNISIQQCVNVSTTPAKRDACFTALTQAPVRDPR